MYEFIDKNGNISANSAKVIVIDKNGLVKEISTGGGGGSPTGPAGGDLSGTYPNPNVVWANGQPTYDLVYYPLPTGTTSQYIDGTGAFQTFPTIPAVSATVSGIVNNTSLQELGGVDKLINNVRIGKGAGNGSNSTVLGENALLNNTTGTSNTAIGKDALLRVTTGSLNTAIGPFSLNSLISGTESTAIGAAVLASSIDSNNTAIGSQTLEFLVTGSGNASLGRGAGKYAPAFLQNTICYESVFLGAETKPFGNNQTNQIVIGNGAVGNGSNSVTIGNDSITKTVLKGVINLNSTPSTGTTSDFVLLRDTSGNVKQIAYPTIGTGSVTSVAALTLGTTGTDLTSTVANPTTTPVITLNVPDASATARGALTSADWSTFNGKQNASTRRNANNSTNNNVNYCGVALGTGVSESSAVWTIKRLTIAASGSITIMTATNVAWTNRESAIYI